MVFKAVEKIQLAVGVICLSTFIIAIMIQVFSRYLGIPMIWTEELANYSFIWSVFMGASIMLYHKEHFKFTLIADSLKGRSKIYHDIIVNIILLAFTLFLLYYGFKAVVDFWNYRWVALPALRMGYVWLCVPTAGFTMSLYIIGHLIDNIKQLKREEQN